MSTTPGPSVPLAAGNDDERLRELAEPLLRHVAMAGYWVDRDRGPDGVVGNGTVSFVDTGVARFLVTNRHVLEDLEILRVDRPDTCLVLNGRSGSDPVVVERWTEIDCGGPGVDLVTLELPDERVVERCGKAWFRADGWPPPLCRVGDVAAFVGFPGQYRRTFRANLKLGAAVVCDFVTAATAADIVMADTARARRLAVFDPEVAALMRWDGVSGSAVYVNDPAAKRWDLAGFVYAEPDEPTVPGAAASAAGAAASEASRATFHVCPAGLVGANGRITALGP